MRRNTCTINNDPQKNNNTRKHKTYVAGSGKNEKIQVKKEIQLKHPFRFAHSIVDHFVNNVLLTKCAQELYKRELEKLVKHAMTHCNSYLQNQNWQLNPNGPHEQKKYQTPLQPDPEPQCRIFDPSLGFQKDKDLNQSKLSSQNSLSLSKFKKNSHKIQRKSIFINHLDNRNSARSNTSRTQKVNFIIEQPKLVPLRFQNGITPEISTRRTLEDFLREKKVNTDINLGYKLSNYSQEKQNLKTIVQFPKSGFQMRTSRNVQSIHPTEKKLPQISSLKEDLANDYDGSVIQIKKTSNLKKTTQILKMVCKVREQNQQKTIQNIQSKYFKPQKIKLKPINTQINTRKDSLNSSVFTMRYNEDEDIKKLIENGLYTNRINFRQQRESHHIEYEQNNMIEHKT